MRLSAGQDGDGGIQRRGAQQKGRLPPETAEVQRVDPSQTGKMVQGFRRSDGEKGKDAKGQKGFPNAVGSFEKAAQKQTVEPGKQHQHKGQKHRICPHQRVLHIHRRIRQEGHAHQRDGGKQHKGCHLQANRRKVFGLHHIGFAHRQQQRIGDVLRLPAVLISLKKSKANEKRAAQNGISGQKGHDGKP